MKNVYLRIVNWKLKSINKPYQLFMNIRANEDLSGGIRSFMRDSNSKIEDVQIYVFENKKQYEVAYKEYMSDLSIENIKKIL